MKKHDRSILKVCETACGNCLYSKHRIVSGERKSEILADIKKKGSYFECHVGSIAGEHIMCHGFYKRHERNMLLIILGKFLERIRFINIRDYGTKKNRRKSG